MTTLSYPTGISELRPSPLPRASSVRASVAPDPFEEDAVADLPIVTTERRLLRLVTAAVQTAARMALDGSGRDAVAWMTRPNRFFDGRSGIDACQELRGFLKATLLNDLSLDEEGSEEPASGGRPRACPSRVPGRVWPEDGRDQSVLSATTASRKRSS